MRPAAARPMAAGPDPAATPVSGGGAARWRDLRKRVASAALLLPAAILCIWLGAGAWTALVAAAAAVLAWEWVRLCGYATLRLPGMAVPLAVFAAGALAVAGAHGTGMLVLAGGGAIAWGIAQWAPAGAPAGAPGGEPAGAPAGAATHPAWLGFGVAYIGAAALALIHLRGDAAAGLGNVLFLFLVVWASDIGAYLAGRSLGGPKLAPAVSPNKTWAGAAGGLLSSVTAGAIAAYVMGPGVSGQAMLVAAVLGLLAQAGDLFESWIKRRFHVKDSSSLIPGHGGLLDRLDGVLAAAPTAALIGLLLGPGERLWH